MRAFYNDFLIDRSPILVPDADLQMDYSDLDSEESGRDESGVMHRIVLRHMVRTWSFSYAFLTKEEYQYMESLFAGKDEFTVCYSGPDGDLIQCVAYRAKRSLTIHNSRTGIYKNYNFNIIEC